MEMLNLPRRSLPIPTKNFDFSPRPYKPKISFNNAHHPSPADLQLNYLRSKQRLNEAIVVLESTFSEEIRPKTITKLLQSCIVSGSIDIGRKVHQHVVCRKIMDPLIETKLVGMYGKCGFLEDARKLFDEIPDKHLLAWSAMIGAYLRERRWREVLELFYLMMEDGVVPDRLLLIKILKACGRCGDVNTGKLVHSIAVKRGADAKADNNIWVSNSLLALYAKCGELKTARRFFDIMEGKDMVSWNSMMTGYCQKGEIEKARELLNLMREERMEPGLITWNLLITSCNRMGRYDVATELMEEMTSHGLIPDVFAYTAMISGFAQNNMCIKALNMFKDMLLEGIIPNEFSVTSAISACSSLSSVQKGKELHSIAVKEGFHDLIPVGNSLIDMYSKRGELEAAQRVFDSILEKDVCSWNSMIGGYCHAGFFGKAHDLFTEMKESNVLPNVVTWNAMIAGYMHNGNDDYAMFLFHEMERDGITKRNTASWNSLMAGYRQNGLTDKALGIFRQMQSCCVAPNFVTILSILPACSNLVAANKVKEIHGCVLRRNFSQTEVSISNCLMDAYARSGNILYPKAIFDRMLVKDIKSWNIIIASFVLHGFPRDAIYHFDLMKKYGLEPNESTFVGIISAYGLAKMVDEGEQVFSFMVEDYKILPRLDHCVAMVQLYGRSRRLWEAIKFIENMEIEPDDSVWAALLTACRVHGDVRLAAHAAEQMNCSPRAASENKNLELLLAQSWIKVKSKVHSFVDDDCCKGYTKDTCSRVRRLLEKHKRPDEPDRFHCERFALAYGLVCCGQESRAIRIVKNKRMCHTCHRFAKFLSEEHGREIYISDTKCLHHFKDGRCSCDDYW